MKVTAIVFAMLFNVLPGVANASTSLDMYSESITRQLSSAEVPKSFAANSAPSNTGSTMEAPIESIDQLNDEPATIIKSQGLKSSKPVKKAKR